MMLADSPTILPLKLKAVSLQIGQHRLIKEVSCRFDAARCARRRQHRHTTVRSSRM